VQIVQIVNEAWAREYKGGEKGLENTLNPRAGNEGCLPSRRQGVVVVLAGESAS
jgi:hypothetical protein